MFDNGIYDLGNQSWRDVRIVHLFEGRDDFPCSHTLSVQAVDFIIHRGKSGLALANDLWLETAVTITWDINIEGIVLCLQSLAGITVATVGIVRWLVALVAKIFIHFSVERSLDRDLLQHRTEITQAFFCLDAIYGPLGQGLKFLFV